MKKALISLSLVSLAAMSGCTFNSANEGSNTVLLVKEYNVKECKKLGTSTAKVKDTLAGVNLPEGQLQKELIVIAKNDALALGGDSIVEMSPVKGGFQVFGIYKCQNWFKMATRLSPVV